MSPTPDSPSVSGGRPSPGEQLLQDLTPNEQDQARRLHSQLPAVPKIPIRTEKHPRASKGRVLREPEEALKRSPFTSEVIKHYMSGRFARIQVSTVAHVSQKLTDDGSTRVAAEIGHALGCSDKNVEFLEKGRLGDWNTPKAVEFRGSMWSFFTAIFRKQLQDHEHPTLDERQLSGLRVALSYASDQLSTIPSRAGSGSGSRHLSLSAKQVLNPVALAMADFQLRLLILAIRRQLVRPARAGDAATQFEATLSDLRAEGLALFEAAKSKATGAIGAPPAFLSTNAALLSHCGELSRQYESALLLVRFTLYISWRTETAGLK